MQVPAECAKGRRRGVKMKFAASPDVCGYGDDLYSRHGIDLVRELPEESVGTKLAEWIGRPASGQ